MEHISCSWIRRQNVVRCPYCLNRFTDSMAFPFQLQQAFLKNSQAESKSYIGIEYLEHLKKNKIWKPSATCSKPYHKVVVWYWYKIDK